MTFHGVPDIKHPWVNTDPAKFESYMEHLKAEGVRLRPMMRDAKISRRQAARLFVQPDLDQTAVISALADAMNGTGEPVG